jgi:hypothetical protein
MITKTGHLFHIGISIIKFYLLPCIYLIKLCPSTNPFYTDFGHFLGNFKAKFGVKRERDKFVFTPEMANVLKVCLWLYPIFIILINII